MQRRRYEILLPLKFNDGRTIPEEAYYETRDELVARFGAVSWVPDPLKGIWLHEGVKYEDSTIRIIVDVEELAESRTFFAEWKPILMERFEQLEIYIISYPIERV